MNTLDAILMKRAVRQFQQTPLTDIQISTIINAGRRAQSAKNTQPWNFIAITDEKILKQLSNLGLYAGHIASAALAVTIITPPPSQRFSIMFDAGQAAAYMQLAAWEMGIGSCLATIYETEKARTLLGFPDDLHAHIAISFGIPLDLQDLTRPPKKGGRKLVSEIYHKNKWQNDV
jgi:nitroreductase